MRHSISLNGTWQFSFSKDNTASDYASQSFSETMSVPGCFDVMAPWYGQRGTAFYRKHLVTGGTVKLSIDGVGFEAELFWDGVHIATLPYAYMPESVTFDAGTRGMHEIVLAVSNRYNGVFMPEFDFYGYGGIYGDVTLEEVPKNHIESLRILATDYRHGIAEIRLRTSQFCRKPHDVTVAFDGGAPQTVSHTGRESVYRMQVPDFRVWSPEHPELHRVCVTFGEDEITETFGIREIRTEGTQVLLNGKPIQFIGYNRHTHHPNFGAAVPDALAAADLRMLKEQGCNFIRGAHYPQRKGFLDLCDQMGFLVWEETLAWAMKPPVLFTPEFLKQQLGQIPKMVHAHFNHPSIVIWAFLNEVDSHLPKTRPIIKKIYDCFAQEDHSRLITFATNKSISDLCLDIVDIIAVNLYPVWFDANTDDGDEIAKIAPRFEEIYNGVKLHGTKPYMISETGAAALYGFHDPFKSRWSEEFQADVVREECRAILGSGHYCGLAFWHFADARVPLHGTKILTRTRGYNNKGHLDEYRRPKLAWFAVKEELDKIKNK